MNVESYGIRNSELEEDEMVPKLHYFNVNGYAESIRYILHYSGQKFEDIRYEKKDWPTEKIKDRLPYGKVPFYEEGDRSLSQSIAIARYLASKNDLLPSDPWEQAVLDAVVLEVYDFANKSRKWIGEKEPTKKEAAKKEFLDDIRYYYSRFEQHLQNNNGHFGGKLSWTDFVLVGIVETVNLYAGTDTEQPYPTIQALFQKIRNLPGVKEYIAKRTTYTISI